MAVYVDDMRAKYGRYVMCHMLADTDEELHAMAAAIGVARKWWQAPPAHTSHYDIALSKRGLAIGHGAIEITKREAAYMCKLRRTTGTLGKLGDVRAHVSARQQVFAQHQLALPTENLPYNHNLEGLA